MYLMTVKAESEQDYPYYAKVPTAFFQAVENNDLNISTCWLFQNGTCQYDPTKGLVSVGNYTNVESGDEKALLEAVATVGPISVSMDDRESGFQVLNFFHCYMLWVWWCLLAIYTWVLRSSSIKMVSTQTKTALLAFLICIMLSLPLAMVWIQSARIIGLSRIGECNT